MKRPVRWTTWCIIGREPDGSEWLAVHSFTRRGDALTELDNLHAAFPRAKFVTRPVSNEVALALPKKEPHGR